MSFDINTVDTNINKTKEVISKQKQQGCYLSSMSSLAQAFALITMSSHVDDMELTMDSIKMAVKQAAAQGQDSFTLKMAITDDEYHTDPFVRAEYEVSEADHEEWDEPSDYDEEMKEMRIFINLPYEIEEIAKEDEQTLRAFLEGFALYLLESLNAASNDWKISISDPTEVFINFTKEENNDG